MFLLLSSVFRQILLEKFNMFRRSYANILICHNVLRNDVELAIACQFNGPV